MPGTETDPTGEQSPGGVEALLGIIGRFTKRVYIWLAVLTVGLLGVAAGVYFNSVKGSSLSHRNCTNVSGIASITRDYIGAQQAQTTELLKRGVTFGIPKDQLPALVKASEASQTAYLAAFDALSLNNC